MDEETLSDAKQRVLDTAERLFMARGYAAITLRDVATELGVRQASLYYHFPGGKAQLYVEMAEHVFERHRKGMQAAIDQAAPNLEAQLKAVAEWFASQPAINVLGMMYADLPAIEEPNRKHLSQTAFRALFVPLSLVFVAAQRRAEARPVHPDLLAGFFLSMMDGITFSQAQQTHLPREIMTDEMIGVLLDGIRPR